MHNHAISRFSSLLLFRQAFSSGIWSFYTTLLHFHRCLQALDKTGRPSTSLQYLVTAIPKGCSLLASAVPTTASTFFRGSTAVSPIKSTLMTLGTPQVMVPVLSNITVLICKKKTQLLPKPCKHRDACIFMAHKYSQDFNKQLTISTQRQNKSTGAGIPVGTLNYL